MSEQTGPSVGHRATAGTLGVSVGVVTAWAFTTATGVAVPEVVAVAWGGITSSVVGLLWSKLGGPA